MAAVAIWRTLFADILAADRGTSQWCLADAPFLKADELGIARKVKPRQIDVGVGAYLGNAGQLVTARALSPWFVRLPTRRI